MHKSKILKKLEEAAKEHGIEIVNKSNGHYILQGGPLTVSYYPFSRMKTAYVHGTTQGKENIQPEQAVQLCLKPPNKKKVKKVAKRRGNSRKKRAALINRGVTSCHWCDKPLTLDTSTLEHIIPLRLGGLDNSNNRTLACKECNHGRGHSMPEIKKEK